MAKRTESGPRRGSRGRPGRAGSRCLQACEPCVAGLVLFCIASCVSALVDPGVTEEPARESQAAGSIFGRVTDQQGKPLAGAAVGVYSPFNKSLQPYTTTGADGSYRIEFSITDAEFWFGAPLAGIVAQASGRAMVYRLEFVDEFSPTVNVDFTLKPGVAVRGSVVDESGMPVPGAIVTTRHEEESYIPLKAFTDEQGEFRLQGLDLDQKEYEIEVYAKGYVSITRRAGREGEEPSSFRLERQSLVLPLGQYREIQVVGRSGNPMGGATILTDPPMGYFGEGIETGSDGKALLSGYTASSCRFMVWKEGHACEFGEVNLEQPGLRIVTLEDEERVIRGRIVDETGRPVSGIVPAFIDTAYRESSSLDLCSGISSTDAEGRFSIPGLRREQRIDVFFLHRLARYDWPELEDISVDEYGGEDVTVRVTTSPVLRGKVVYKDTGQPVRCFRINATRPLRGKQGMGLSAVKGSCGGRVFCSQDGRFATYVNGARRPDLEDEIQIEVGEGADVRSCRPWEILSLSELGCRDLVIRIGRAAAE